jgi:RNA polymerase sigma-70 factor (ECF subfamily)
MGRGELRVSTSPESFDAEARIRECHARQEMQEAATLLLEAYSRELFGFLVSRLRDREAAFEVFGVFSEDLWLGIPGFRWQCSARAWAYALIRHAASRYRAGANKQLARNVALTDASAFSDIAQRIRTDTALAFKTATRSRIAELREQLPPDDQTLLVLRINRGLDWLEIARIMSLGPDAADEAALRTEAARLRKRFQLTKAALRRMAQRAGILEESEET